MHRMPRFAQLVLFASCLSASGAAFAASPAFIKDGKSAPSLEMSFTKGDSRNGSQVHLRIVGDSLYYRQILYRPDLLPSESRKAFLLNGHRRNALKGVLGHLPRYPVFGTCFGKDMGFYMVETAEGRFYRSLPERSGKCYADEPGIWSLFQDLDDLLAPPSEPEYREYSAS